MLYIFFGYPNQLLRHYPAQNIAATALFLAAKAEENCRKTKEVVIAVAKVAQKNANLVIDEQSKEFWRWKDSILLHEEIMLELLTFDVIIESPYTQLYEFLRALEIETNKPLRNAAWAFLNDSYMTTLCLMMTARDIAVASIYFSAKLGDERIPDDRDGKPWWTYLNGSPERMCKAIDVMSDFYTDNPLKKTDNPYDRSPQSSVEDLDRTRLRVESLSPNSRIRAEEIDDEESQQNGTDGLVKDSENGVAKAEDGSSLKVSNGDVAGDDDTKLKAIANCPETHEQSQENGVINSLVSTSYGGASCKRKDSDTDVTGEPNAKRLKSENDESEEGEVEE
jgi:protein BUR2